MELSCPLQNHSFQSSIHPPRSSLHTVVLGFYDASLHKCDRWHHWLLNSVSSLFLSLAWGVVKQSSNPLITRLVFLTTSPSPHLFSKSNLINITRNTFVVVCRAIPRLLRALSQKPRPTIRIYYKSHYNTIFMNWKAQFCWALNSLKVSRGF